MFMIGQLICSSRKFMAFNPPVPTPEVQTSQSSVLLGRGSVSSAFWGRTSGGREPITERDSRFPVRPANTTVYQPVCEFIGSATDIEKRIIIISIGSSVQDVNGYLFRHYSVRCCLFLFLSVIQHWIQQ